MKKCLLSVTGIVLFLFCNSQNVGIGNASPSEKLDVNGNVNITGTLKANGVAGQNGQVLMSTGTGLSWGSTAGYRKSKSFNSGPSNTFTVPAGVTEVMVEAWGAGSGGTLNVGGTSGGYARAVKTVNPGDVINIAVGTGSNFGTTTSSPGGNSTVTFGADILTAYGGGGIPTSSYRGQTNSGTFSGNFDNAYFLYGASGKTNTLTGYLKNATTYVELDNYGAGGMPVGFLNAVEEPGDYVRLENGGAVSATYGQNARFPSGGGPAGYNAGGWSGANGFVVIWWN